MRDLPSLEEFIVAHKDRMIINGYVKFAHLNSYVILGPRVVHGKRLRVICRGNTSNTRRLDNGEINSKRKSTGLYRAFDQHCYDMAKKHGFAGVYVENVLNRFLPAKLLEYGYQDVTRDELLSVIHGHSFYKPVE